MNLFVLHLSPILMIVLLVFLPIAAALYFPLRKQATCSGDRLAVAFLTILLSTFVSMLAGLILLDAVMPDEMLVSKKGRIVAVGQEAITIFHAKHVWQWIEPYKSAEVVKLRNYDPLYMSVTPITENPRVVPLIYNVVVENNGTPEDALRFHWQGGMRSVKRELYNINRFKSAEMAEKFFNPLSELQQSEFKRFMSKNLRSVLPSGYVVKEAAFDLN